MYRGIFKNASKSHATLNISMSVDMSVHHKHKQIYQFLNLRKGYSIALSLRSKIYWRVVAALVFKLLGVDKLGSEYILNLIWVYSVFLLD